MRILQVVEQAYRTLVEEQDDTILWITQCMLNAGAEFRLLLSGNCCYYATLNQRQPKLHIGSWSQKEPADIVRDLQNLQANGVPIYVNYGDLADRGLVGLPLHPAVTVIDRDVLATLYEEADQVWQW